MSSENWREVKSSTAEDDHRVGGGGGVSRGWGNLSSLSLPVITTICRITERLQFKTFEKVYTVVWRKMILACLFNIRHRQLYNCFRTVALDQ